MLTDFLPYLINAKFHFLLNQYSIISIVVGFIGAYIGTILAREFNFPDFWSFEIRGISYPIVWSIVGAAVFTAILSLIVPKKD